MSESESAENVNFANRHSFLLLIITSITVSIGVVVISMAMYNGSGAAQLDLSRPGYKSIRSQVLSNGSDFKPFSATGELNGEVISEFRKQYEDRTANIKAVDAFGGDPLSLEALGISDRPL